MAVHDRSYRRWQGEASGALGRFLVIPRFAWERLIKSRFNLLLLLVSVVFTLGASVLVYLQHNAAALAVFGLTEAPLPIDAAFFQGFLAFQMFLGALFVLIAGPPLISMDVANGALPLYLSRPITRPEYVLGKFSILGVALSLFTWVPGLLLYGLQANLEGAGWGMANARLVLGIFVGSLLWIAVFSFLTLALSAWIRWPLAVRGVLLVVVFVLPAFGLAFNAISGTHLGDLIRPIRVLVLVIASLFGTPVEGPTLGAWLVVAFVLALSVFLIDRKLRAYEVVS